MLAIKPLYFVVAVLSSAVLAAPTEDGKPNIEARLTYDCGGTVFTSTQAQEGYGDATTALKGDVVYRYGVRTYPGVFRNGGSSVELDPSPCAGKQLLEFPILASGSPYTGGTPGPHRVVMAEHGDGTSYDQCFLMTHQGASGNLFNKCV
ncbi:putative Ribonuclease T(1) [Seiridium cardinale]